MQTATDRTAQRFWNKVRKSDGCWEWTARRDREGYGVFKERSYVQVKAHRFSWKLHFGDVPAGLYVCHHCDNRCCVRPEHLFIGTAGDNNRDMVAKGRQRQLRGHRKTHCPRGHEYTTSSSRSWTDAKGKLFRRCRLCHAAVMRRRRAAARGRPTQA